jgi:hypothetical protein
MVTDDDWSTEQVVAVTELLHVIHSRYQGRLYGHWTSTRITQFEVDASKETVNRLS